MGNSKLLMGILLWHKQMKFSVSLTEQEPTGNSKLLIGTMLWHKQMVCHACTICCRTYEDLEEAVVAGDVRSEGGQLPISFEQAFSLQHR